jgi:hypothetical protein
LFPFSIKNTSKSLKLDPRSVLIKWSLLLS